jgi:predicted HicB family RNase H-like nuclease
MSALRYGDYQGAVTYEDGRLVIQILHIEDTITTECDSASQAQAAFEELVKDYLATCEQVGKEPSKPFKGSFNVRVSPALHKAAAMAAAEQDESLNSFVCRALECLIEKEKECEEVISAAQTDFNLLSGPEVLGAWAHRCTWEVAFDEDAYDDAFIKMQADPRTISEYINWIYKPRGKSSERRSWLYEPVTMRGRLTGK